MVKEPVQTANEEVSSDDSTFGYASVAALMALARNQKDRKIDCNDIARFPRAAVAPIASAKWQDGKCTNCGRYGLPTYDGGNERTTFCPHCGAKMT